MTGEEGVVYQLLSGWEEEGYAPKDTSVFPVGTVLGVRRQALDAVVASLASSSLDPEEQQPSKPGDTTDPLDKPLEERERATHRFRKIDGQEIRFVTKDTSTGQTVETTYTPAAFLATLADHISDRYRHNIRYFGLLAPRVKSDTHDAVFALVGQERLGKPPQLRWAASLKKSFGIDPLLDRDGQRMRWDRRIPPAPAQGHGLAKPALGSP